MMTSLEIYQSKNQQIMILGDQGAAGTYLLRINLVQPVSLKFGQFHQAKAIVLPEGDYIYIGSALGKKGATSLGNRISRHCDRSPPRQEHAIRQVFREFCDTIDLPYSKHPSPKTCHWNIDYLTDLPTAEITGIIAFRSPLRLEHNWAIFLEEQLQTKIIEKGLGANDSPGETHLLSLQASDRWWNNLATRLTKDKEN